MSKCCLPMMFGVIALATCASAALAAPNAVRDDSAESVAVSFADLDLQRDADVQTLLGRLSTAARHVCGAFNEGQKGVDARRLYDDCRRSAMEGGIASVASAKLSAAYAARTPGQFLLADRRR